MKVYGLTRDTFIKMRGDVQPHSFVVLGVKPFLTEP